MPPEEGASPTREAHRSPLRRELGVLESYAAMVGILVGAGIFRVTADAAAATGPSVLLGYVVLAPLVLASAVPYMAFLSTQLGLGPGGEYSHVRRTLGSDGLAFLGAWLKLIAYAGAGAYLSGALADYLFELPGLASADFDRARWREPVAFAGLSVFAWIHLAGVRWFGRVQVAMCALLGVSIVVLVVPGLFAIETRHYRPFFPNGSAGFLASLPPLLFAFAGFESLAQTAGEVHDAPEKLPRVFLKGILITTAIFFLISAVAFGVMPSAELQESPAPMSAAAARYLPAGASTLVTLGALLAVATSLNATLLVPARLSWVLGRDGLLPAWAAAVHAGSGSPRLAVLASFTAMAALLWSRQVHLALTIAVIALLILYAVHSLALLLLPRRSPELFRQLRTELPRSVLSAAAWVSILGMGGIVLFQLTRDAEHMLRTTFVQRFEEKSLTSLEMLLAWGALGALVFRLRPGRDRRGKPRPAS